MEQLAMKASEITLEATIVTNLLQLIIRQAPNLYIWLYLLIISLFDRRQVVYHEGYGLL
jgi:hypothetical protein